MAADWIKMRSNLWDDPRVAAIVDATDSSEAAVIGALYWLWAMADQHTEDGYLPGLSLRQIDRKTGVAGFAEALKDLGWIVVSVDGGIFISHFTEHNGVSAKKRAQTARRVASFKAGNAQSDEILETGNEASVTESGNERDLEKEKEKEPPLPPKGESAGGEAGQPKSKREAKIGLESFLQACRDAGESAIPKGDGVFVYADSIGLPRDFVALAWRWFKGRYATKRQAGVRGWRQTFRNAVEGNWPKFWYADDTGAWHLTTAGKQAKLAADAENLGAAA